MKKIISFALIGLFLMSGISHAGISYGQSRKVVATAGTAEALSATTVPFTNATICAETDNTGVIVLGGSGVVASQATRQGTPLSAGDCKTYPPFACNGYVCGDLKDIYADSTVNGDGVTIEYTQTNL